MSGIVLHHTIIDHLDRQYTVLLPYIPQALRNF